MLEIPYPHVRLAAMGWLLYLHHTFHEIMTAAAGAGGPGYSGSCDYGELNPPGKAAIEGAIGPMPGTFPAT